MTWSTCRRRGVAPVLGFVAALLVSTNVAVHGQTATPPAVIDAVQVGKAPLIDGIVAETEWQGAAMVSSFIQFEPRRGDPSDIRTESLVLYDAGHLYVAFRAWDTEAVTAQLTQRDAELLRDDAVVLVVDTTNDRRSAYYFITNALGTQADGRISTMAAHRRRRGTRLGSRQPGRRTTAGRQNSASPCRR